MNVRLEVEGLSVESGKWSDFGIYSELQRSVMPVVSLQEGYLRCWGSAACIGTGWFITARHVVDDFIEAYGEKDDGTTGLYVMWESNDPVRPGSQDVRGAPLPVTNYHRHSQADLVSLTTKTLDSAANNIRVVTLAFRMPQIGEPLAIVGYRHMTMIGRVHPGPKRSVVDYERILSVAVGVVLEQQPDRRSAGYRGFPGVATNAPIKSGMSGGPVFDSRSQVVGFASSSMEPSAQFSDWNSYVALCGPALELKVRGLGPQGDLEELPLSLLASTGNIAFSTDDTFDIDPVTRVGIYLPK